jgi:hypothetical protein
MRILYSLELLNCFSADVTLKTRELIFSFRPPSFLILFSFCPLLMKVDGRDQSNKVDRATVVSVRLHDSEKAARMRQDPGRMRRHCRDSVGGFSLP